MTSPSIVSLSFLLSTLWLSVSVSALPNNIWEAHIDNGPAPSPEDGPPLSASAIRDRAYLGGEIGGIIGAYFLVVIAITAALLTVGRRLRGSAQTSPRSLAMEMLKPSHKADSNQLTTTTLSPSQSNPWGPSPISPGSTTKREWPSPMKSRDNVWGKKGHSIQSSVVTFDESVIEEDKTKNEIEMDRLYAAVAEHEDQRSTSMSNHSLPYPPQNPPEFQHLRSPPQYRQPLSPPLPEEPTSPSRTTTTSPLRTLTTSPPRVDPTSLRYNKPAPLPLGSLSRSRASSRSSFASSYHKRSIRNLPISPPMGSPDFQPDNLQIYGDAEPLSPRLYTPRPPPTPPANRPDSTTSLPSEPATTSPRRFHFPSSIRSSRISGPSLPASPRLPPPQSQNPIFHLTPDSNPSLPLSPTTTTSSPPSKSRKPAPLSLLTTTSSTTTLPLRTAPLPLRNPNPTNRFSTIKATVLEHNPAGLLRAPGTAVPATPYSPYMPFTPLTPMTPSRLVTREERKRREREEGRRVLREEDKVVEEGEMWGDAYA